MVQYEDMTIETREESRLLRGGVTVLAVHNSRGLAFVKENNSGRIRTAKTGNRRYERFTKVQMFKTGVLY